MITFTSHSNEHYPHQEKIAVLLSLWHKEWGTSSQCLTKRILLFFLALFCFALGLNAQVTKTVNLTIAGSLSTVLSADELNTITNFTLTGNIDARDFKTMRSLMPA